MVLQPGFELISLSISRQRQLSDLFQLAWLVQLLVCSLAAKSALTIAAAVAVKLKRLVRVLNHLRFAMLWGYGQSQVWGCLHQPFPCAQLYGC
jgi:hypothetical protein